MWRKMSCFELATRVPFILHVPWMKEVTRKQLPSRLKWTEKSQAEVAAQTAGTRTKQLVEMVDVLPTLLELGGVEMPANETFDGVSLVPLAAGSATSTGKNMSFSQYARSFAARDTPVPYPPTNLSDLWALDAAGQNARSTFCKPPRLCPTSTAQPAKFAARRRDGPLGSQRQVPLHGV